MIEFVTADAPVWLAFGALALGVLIGFSVGYDRGFRYGIGYLERVNGQLADYLNKRENDNADT